MCIHQDDAMGYYDRIIRSHAILNVRKFGILENIYKIYSVTCDKMVFKLQLNGISQQGYSNTWPKNLHDVGQGSSNGRSKWTFIGIQMMNIVAQTAQGYELSIPKGLASWKVHMLGFVDDKR